jgi:hypothetical protein
MNKYISHCVGVVFVEPLGSGVMNRRWVSTVLMLFFKAQQPLVCQDLLTLEASRSNSDTPHSVGLLWTWDLPDAETST